MLDMRWAPSNSISPETPGYTRNAQGTWTENHKCQDIPAYISWLRAKVPGTSWSSLYLPVFPEPGVIRCKLLWHWEEMEMGRRLWCVAVMEGGVLFLYSGCSFSSQTRDDNFLSSYGVPIDKNKIF